MFKKTYGDFGRMYDFNLLNPFFIIPFLSTGTVLYGQVCEQTEIGNKKK